jgi:hypothetical protein
MGFQHLHEPEQLFLKIASTTANARLSKMFGALSIKCNNGKNAAFFWENSMAFKLDNKILSEALNIDGANIASHLYAPEKLMKSWVMIPYGKSEHWKMFTEEAIKFVNNSK